MDLEREKHRLDVLQRVGITSMLASLGLAKITDLYVTHVVAEKALTALVAGLFFGGAFVILFVWAPRHRRLKKRLEGR